MMPRLDNISAEVQVRLSAGIRAALIHRDRGRHAAIELGVIWLTIGHHAHLSSAKGTILLLRLPRELRKERRKWLGRLLEVDLRRPVWWLVVHVSVWRR